MKTFDLLRLLNPDLEPEATKIHLATWNGIDQPLDVYLAGDFDEWQRWQTKRNFERAFVLSLIALPEAGQWLFAGVHRSGAVKPEQDLLYYPLVEDERCRELNGRMVVSFSRTGRQSYLLGENWADQLDVSHILPKRMSIGEFPGYRHVNLTKAELDMVVGQSLTSWRIGLSSVAGVYLISDTRTGLLYVGSASSEQGIWGRWSAYAADGHGGNVELRKLLDNEGHDRSGDFRYSILEIADIHASDEEILRRESHWKDVLLSRSHGLNAN